MRLVACPKCHRQYNVSTHAPGERVRCVCDEVLVVRHRESHAPRAVRCSSCGGPLEDGVSRCAYCRSEVRLEDRVLSSVCPECFARMASSARYCMECGTTIDPQSLAAVPEGSKCPRCKEGLHSRALGIINIVECGACRGMWVTPDVFHSLCDDAQKQAQALAALMSQPNDQAPAKPKHQTYYLPCVMCEDLMVPRNFPGSQGIIIDVCKNHGVWLDHTELEGILECIRSGRARADALSRNLEGRSYEKSPVDTPFSSMRRVHPDVRFEDDIDVIDDVVDVLRCVGGWIGKLF